MKSLIHSVAFATVILALPAAAQTAAPADATTSSPHAAVAAQGMTSQEFVTAAASGGMYEIQSSQVLLDAGVDNEELQEFAQQMVTDHEAAAEQLKAAAGDLTVPAELAPNHADMLAELESSDDMAATYVEQQVMAHEESIALHEAYAGGGDDADLVAYAEEVLPTLNEHYEHIQSIAGN